MIRTHPRGWRWRVSPCCATEQNSDKERSRNQCCAGAAPRLYVFLWSLCLSLSLYWLQKVKVPKLEKERYKTVKKIENKKLCRYRGTSQRVLSIVTTKVTSKLTQGNWYSCHSIGHT